MTHLTEEDLILAYYNEPGASQAQAHLAVCPECREAAESLARALSVCSEWTVPERPSDFGRDVWLRLTPQLDVQPVSRGWRGIFAVHPVRVFAMAAGFAVLLTAVFLAGRYSRPAEPRVLAGLSDRARERILGIAVADHLDRVQILMTEMANETGTNPDTLDADKARAEDLVQEGRLVRQSLAARGETATTSFLDEVERFLIETAHTPDSASAAEVRELHDRIEAGSLLFKVRVVESNLRNNLSNGEQKL
jgi:hypothetical protein